jgi:hypothetical protein
VDGGVGVGGVDVEHVGARGPLPAETAGLVVAQDLQARADDVGPVVLYETLDVGAVDGPAALDTQPSADRRQPANGQYASRGLRTG